MGLKLAIDFDGTLVEKDEPLRWRPGAKEALIRFSAAGHQLILHSCRCNTMPLTPNTAVERERFYATGESHPDVLEHFERFEAMQAFLKREGVWEILRPWQEPGKPLADRYIDDRAEPPNWRMLLGEFGFGVPSYA